MLEIAPPVADPAGRRIVADLGGEPLWFASDDVPLSASMEAMASATMLAAAFCGERLALAAPVDRTWLRGVGRAMRIFARWWNVPSAPPVASGVTSTPGRARGTALLFTGGVDSFHSLLTRGAPPDLLVFVHGYDVALADTVRADAVIASLLAVAAATGARPVVVRTNLREHPLLRGRGTWEEVHGGALAAVGHLLAGTIDRLVVSSSFSRRYHVPWGSHFRTDHLWSSRGLRVEHFGAHANRTQKIAAIAADPLVHAHLRVCWENRTPTGNCGACVKCTVTMTALAQVGRLADVRTLVPAAPLHELLQQPGMERFWQALREIVALDAGSTVGRTVAARLPQLSPARPAPRWRRLADALTAHWPR